MKALLILSILLAGVLVATAAAVGAAETAPQKLQEENQLVEEEAADFVPEAKQSEEVSAREVASSPQGWLFTCPSGWVNYKGDCYLFVASSRSWSNAVTNCANYGASLASARDVFDYSFLQELTSRSGYTHAWMGGFYFETWRWLDQSPFNDINWSFQFIPITSYPCIYLRTAAPWVNSACTTGRPSICMRKTTQ